MQVEGQVWMLRGMGLWLRKGALSHLKLGLDKGAGRQEGLWVIRMNRNLIGRAAGVKELARDEIAPRETTDI